MLLCHNETTGSRCHRHPDGHALYHIEGGHYGFFLACDRGTMNHRDYVKKFSTYHDYAIARQFERDYHGYPTILMITINNGAEEQIARVARAAAVGHSIALPLLLTCRWRIDDARNLQSLLGPIWREPHALFNDRHAWPPSARDGYDVSHTSPIPNGSKKAPCRTF